jgi:hypothetical protein
MPGEDQKGVGSNLDAEEVKPDAQGKYPETVPWGKYVGIKESLGNKLTAEREKVKGLEEQLKKAPNAEEFNRVKGELDTVKGQLTQTTTELTNLKEKSVLELKAELKKRNISDEEVAKMSEAEMRTVIRVLGDIKPAPDLGSGGGSGELRGSPLELATQAYSDKK